jgi:hypothetical protein
MMTLANIDASFGQVATSAKTLAAWDEGAAV